MILHLRLVGLLLCAVGFCVSAPSLAFGCNVPVFRYALERWRADHYEVIVFHRGPLAAESRSQIDRWQLQAYDEPGLGNITAVTVDVDDLTEAWQRELWAKQTAEQLPWAVVVPPWRGNTPPVVWSGPLEKLRWSALCNSPGRQQLVKQLTGGDAVVWLVVAGADATKNAELKERMTAGLAHWAKEIPLPPGIGEVGSELLTDVPLEVRFGQTWVERDDPQEELFIAQLLAQRADLRNSTEPIVVPVFGRGRALDTLTGDEVDEAMLEDVSAFLCAACSCRVKEQNPGYDLLLAYDWNSLLKDDAETAALIRVADDESSQGPQLVTIPPGTATGQKTVAQKFTAPAEEAFVPKWLTRTLFYGPVIGLLLCLVAALWPQSAATASHAPTGDRPA